MPEAERCSTALSLSLRYDLRARFTQIVQKHVKAVRAITFCLKDAKASISPYTARTDLPPM
jgi:hypothetical protein